MEGFVGLHPKASRGRTRFSAIRHEEISQLRRYHSSPPSTASYQQRNLQGIRLRFNDLTDWDLSWQDLTDADFFGSTFKNTNLSGANLTNASLYRSSLTNADLSGSTVLGAELGFTDLTKEQLYSTFSYQQRNLRGINLVSIDLTDWDFRGQDLRTAVFALCSGQKCSLSTFTNADFSAADLRRSAGFWPARSTVTHNAIRPDGEVWGLDLATRETLVVRDSDIGITVSEGFTISQSGVLEVLLADAEWGSTITVEGGITPQLGGTLRVDFAPESHFAELVGTTFNLFDWTSPLDSTNQFAEVQLASGTQWDLSRLIRLVRSR